VDSGRCTDVRIAIADRLCWGTRPCSRPQRATMNLSQEDNRHAHLLKPIRELAANWDINIASELEEYLVRVQTRIWAYH